MAKEEASPRDLPPALAAAILAHLDSAHNLARWLVRDPAAAEDVVQDAVVRALRYGGGWRGGDARAWLLRIVRNTAMDWLRGRGREQPLEPEMETTLPDPAPDPEAVMAARQARHGLTEAMAALPPEWRECLMLRTVEDLSYRQIAAVTGVPIGTVMSRLWRARAALLQAGLDA